MRIVRTTYLDAPDLGGRIYELRRKDKRTLREIAALAEITTQHWYKIEKEQVDVPEETLQRIQKSLGVDFQIKFD